MSLKYIFLTALANIKSQIGKSSMVIFSIMIAVVPLMLLLSFGKFGHTFLLSELERLNVDIIKVNADIDVRHVKSQLLPYFKTVSFKENYDEDFIKILGEVSPVRTIYVDSEYGALKRLKMKYGRFFSPTEVVRDSMVCVIQDHSKLPDRLKISGIVGALVQVGKNYYKVVGIVEPAGSRRYESYSNPKVYLPLTPLQLSLKSKNTLSIQSTDILKVKENIQFLDMLLSKIFFNHKPYKLFDRERQAATVVEIISKVKWGLLGGSILAFVLGGLGIINIMLLSVKNRSQEIGTLKAIGAEERIIVTQFMIEAAIIGIIGGLVGIIVGFSVKYGIEFWIKIPYPISFTSVITSWGAALALGVTAGFIPARRAARMDPIEALRTD